MKLHLPHFLKRILFEDSDDPLAPSFKRRRVLNNSITIQCLSFLIGISLIAIIPLIITLLTIPYFSLVFIVVVVAINNLIYALTKYYERKDKHRLNIIVI